MPQNVISEATRELFHLRRNQLGNRGRWRLFSSTERAFHINDVET